MKFVVIPHRRVVDQLRLLSRASQYRYLDHIVPVLADDPFPGAGSTVIRALPRYGPDHFQYYDGVVPLVFQYKLFLFNGPASGGVLWIWRAVPDATYPS